MHTLKVYTCLLLTMSLCAGCELIQPITPIDEDELDMSSDADISPEMDARGTDADMTRDAARDDADIAEDADMCADLVCGEGFMCEAQQCVCVRDEACGVGQICEDGGCVDVECTEENAQTQCAVTERCEANVCVPIMCASSMDCPGQLSCDLDRSVCIQGCASDLDCTSPANQCIQGECVDVLSDERHCGQEGDACRTDVGSQCVDGFCTCAGQAVSATTSLSRDVLDRFEISPGVGIVAYPSLDLYRCSEAGQDVASCDASRVFDEDYALDMPHYLVYGVPEAFPTRVRLVTLDGRGEQIASIDIDNPREVLLVRVLALKSGALKVFTLLEGDSQNAVSRQINSHEVVDSGAAALSILQDGSDSNLSPRIWATGEHIVDFAVAEGVHESNTIIAVPVIELEDGATTSGTLSLHGFEFGPDGSREFSGESFSLSKVGQLWRGFSASVVNASSGPEVHVISLDGTFDSGLISPEPEPAGFAQMFYNRRVFELDLDEGITSTTRRDDARTVSIHDTLIEGFASLSSTPSDGVDIPPAMSLQQSGGQDLVATGWSRYIERRGMSRKDKAAHTYVTLGGGGTSRAVELDDLNRVGMYDQAYVHDQGRQVAYRVEASVSNGSLASSAQIKLSKFSQSNPPQVVTTREVTPLSSARAVSVAPSPHATGVLVRSDEAGRARATLFFVVDKDEPVCMPR